MGNALSIAATSRLLHDIIEGNVTRYGLDGYVGNDVLVTAEPPMDDDERRRINVFLYRAIENANLRNEPLPSHDARGNPVRPPLLTLDLHYAVTAYAESDYQSELMMGCAMQALHETPVLNRALIRDILNNDPGPNSIMDSRLFEQIQSIRIRHRNLPEEAFTRLWSAFHVPYRLTTFYEVAVVLVESDAPTSVSPPVLSRPRPAAHGSTAPVTPTLLEASATSGAPGDVIQLNGVSLEGTNIEVEAIHPDPSVERPVVAIPPADASDGAVAFTVPATWPVGTYELRLHLDPPGGNRRVSNRLPFTVRPAVTVDTLDRDAAPPQHLTVTLSVAPEVQPGQHSTLILGARAFSGPAVNAAAGTLVFADLDIPAGNVVLRLQVDGIENAWLDHSTSPATVLPAANVVLP